MSRTKWLGVLATAGALVLGAGGAGYAKPVFQEDFRASKSGPAAGGANAGSIVKHRSGYAWQGMGGDSTTKDGGYRVYDVAAVGLNANGGTVEFDLTRGETDPCESLFSFGDADGKNLFTFRVMWESHDFFGNKVGPVVRVVSAGEPYVLYTLEEDDHGNLSRTPGWIVRKIAKGQTVHFAVTWGAHGLAIYLDGKKLEGNSTETTFFEKGLPKVRTFVLGGEISDRVAGKVWCTTRSLLENVQIHDAALQPNQLGAAFSTGVEITSVSHDAAKMAGFSGKLVAGNVIAIALAGTPGAEASFDLVHYTNLDGKIELDWRGWGTYLEEKTFYEEGEVDLSAAVNYRVYASKTAFADITAEMMPVTTLDIKKQEYTLETLEIETPYYVAVVAEMRDGTLKKVIWPVQGVKLAETAPGTGKYAGSYGITYGDRFPRGVVIGRLRRGDDVVTVADSANLVAADPALTIAVATSPNELKADEKSVSQVTVSVTDANGNPVAGHKIKFLLATTSQYTGVVGGGAFTDQVGGSIKDSSYWETDLFGKVSATYVAGFAAKTAVIVARDMTSNDTGAGWVKTYIQATAQIELIPVRPTAAMDQGYEISVTTSDEWLTADGKSTAKITALVTRNGEPVEGHKVDFSVSSGTGTIRVAKDTTDKKGQARAVYTAGKKIGLVVITATDTTVDISGSVQIELRSDAPAKIAFKLNPEKLPADGRSRADLTVTVTDINDNPNDNVEVEYALGQGSGRLKVGKGQTDKSGVSENVYTAGNSAGTVSIDITVRSTVPTDDELVKAQNLALAVPDYAFR